MLGCVVRLLLLPVTIGLLYPLMLLRSPFPTIVFPAEGAEVTAVIAGIFLWWTVISLMDRRRLSATLARLNAFGLRDGEEAVVSGAIQAKGPLLRAPFSGEPCVGYYYKASHTTHSASSSGRSRWTDFEGWALVPSVISSKRGDVRVLAECDKELFHEVPSTTCKDVLDRARGYLQDAPRKDVNGPGDFRQDEQVGKQPGLEKCDFEEKLVRNGDRVLVSGIYAGDLNGIKPHPDDVMAPYHLVSGGEEALVRKVRNRTVGAVIAALLAFATVGAYFLVFIPRQG